MCDCTRKLFNGITKKGRKGGKDQMHNKTEVGRYFQQFMVKVYSDSIIRYKFLVH